jgi:hypothetical protein
LDLDGDSELEFTAIKKVQDIRTTANHPKRNGPHQLLSLSAMFVILLSLMMPGTASAAPNSAASG